MPPTRTLSLALVALLASAACSTLVKESDRCSSDEECIAAFGPGTSCESSGFCVEPDELLAADLCSSSEVPVLVSSPQPVRIDTGLLTDRIRDLASCTEFESRGNDGFFAVDMTLGQKWHFHANIVGESANPSVYVLRSCDARTCQAGDAIDVCDDGHDEHLSFAAPAAGRYFVGIDSRNTGGQIYDVLALSPVCGDGQLDHSETCDDSNTEAGDGCDDRCRTELMPASPTTLTFEVEPNDDFSSANHVLPEALSSQVKVSGRLGGRCDFDMYTMQVPEGGSIEAEMFQNLGALCDTQTEYSMTLLDSSAVRTIGTGSVRVGSCPSITAADSFATGLAEGLYYVRVTTEASSPAADYELHFRVLGP